MIKPKEKPIIFSGPSIPAIQNLKPGTWPPEPIDPGKPWKWQTRRIVKDDIVNGFDIDIDGKVIAYIDQATGGSYKPEEICPYPPGTRLWVRETWAKRIHSDNRYYYKADNNLGAIFNREDDKWRSPIFMPRAAARLFLEVKNVRVERLQNINHEDAIAEGTLQWICEEHKSGSYFDNAMRGAACAKPERAFALLWDSINAKRGYPWENNDWVFVYSFGRIDNYGKN